MSTPTPERRALLRVRRKQHLVRVLRSTRFGGDLDGFVVGVGKKWALLAAAEDGYVRGWVATRLEHVDRIQRDRSCLETFARSQPTWPPAAPGDIDLDSTSGLLTSMQAHGALVSVEQEDRIAQASWVGRLHEVSGGRLWLHEVDTRARWDDEPLGYRLRNITLVSMGTPYLLALAHVLSEQGTPMPPPVTSGQVS